MKNTKKYLSLMLVIILITSIFSGCSSSDENQKAEVPAVDEKNDSEEVVTEEDVIAEEVVTEDELVKPEELGSGEVKWKEETTSDNFIIVANEGGATLGYSVDSGLKIIQVDGFAFKDLNKNEMLDKYEDWRLSSNERAVDLATKVSVEDIAGLMLFSTHQSVIGEELTEDQIAFLDDGGRAVLNAGQTVSTEDTAKWNNSLQSYSETTGFGIPVNTSSDPREIGVSSWPSNLGLAATFNSDLVAEAGKVISTEYRLLGIGTLLGPQIDLSSEPRWSRVSGTFGSDPALSRDLTNAYVSGIQSTYDEDGNDLGWGEYSMNAMIKHWPGDGAGEGGRESHVYTGNSTVYPGNQFETHLIPFVDGGFDLESETEAATAIMSSYSIAYSDDEKYGELVASAYSEYKISELLRGQYGYEGVICTDWGVINDLEEYMQGSAYGMFELTKPERAYSVIMAGVDQFGGNDNATIIVDAYQIGIDEIGEEAIRERFEVSAVRLLKNLFTVGLFENAYLDVEKSVATVESEEFVAKGYEAQLKSVVMVKNTEDLISSKDTDEKPTVYIPMRFVPEAVSFFGGESDGYWELPVNIHEASEFYNVVTDTINEVFTGTPDADGNPTPSYNDVTRLSSSELANIDYSLVVIKNPMNLGDTFLGYGIDSTKENYVPISLQYSPYTANGDNVRKESISGDIIIEEKQTGYVVEKVEVKENRSYYGNDALVTNFTDLQTVIMASENTSAPVVVAIEADRPMILSEIDQYADAIVIGFGIKNKAIMEVVAGKSEPSGLLPVQLPKDMDTVEAQFEDVPRDMECYVDSNGNTYDFAYGLNWSGVIDDARTQMYDVEALTVPVNQGN